MISYDHSIAQRTAERIGHLGDSRLLQVAYRYRARRARHRREEKDRAPVLIRCGGHSTRVLRSRTDGRRPSSRS